MNELMQHLAPRTRPHPRSPALALLALPPLFAALLLGVLLTGCGDDNATEPADGDTQEPPGRGTIDSLITAYFPYYYSRRDSAAYDAMLLGDFRFYKLPSDPDEPAEELFWDDFEEMRIAGRMFGGVQNPDGQSIDGIALQIRELVITDSEDPDEPPGVDWFDVDASVELLVTVNDPSVPDSTGRITFDIKTPQTFVVTEDPLFPGDWGLVRQFDRGPPPKAAGSSTTEDASWGAVKGLFR